MSRITYGEILVSPSLRYVKARSHGGTSEFSKIRSASQSSGCPLPSLKETSLATEFKSHVASAMSDAPTSRRASGLVEANIALSSVHDPGHARHAAFLMKLCFALADPSPFSCERMGEALETMFGVCFLAARLPTIFSEK